MLIDRDGVSFVMKTMRGVVVIRVDAVRTRAAFVAVTVALSLLFLEVEILRRCGGASCYGTPLWHWSRCS